MRKKRPTEEKSINLVSAWDVTAAVGIVAMQIVESVQYAEHSDNWTVLENLAEQLDSAIFMQAAFCMENERLLRLISVEVPPNMAVIRVRNPMYTGRDAKLSPDGDSSTVEDLGELPF